MVLTWMPASPAFQQTVPKFFLNVWSPRIVCTIFHYTVSHFFMQKRRLSWWQTLLLFCPQPRYATQNLAAGYSNRTVLICFQLLSNLRN